MSAPHRRV